MSLYMIYATLREQMNEVVRYCLINKNSLETIDVDADGLCKLVQEKKIDNIEIKKNRQIDLKWGSLDDYPILNVQTNCLVWAGVGNVHLFTIVKVDSSKNKCIVCNEFGESKEVDIADIAKASSNGYGISNEYELISGIDIESEINTDNRQNEQFMTVGGIELTLCKEENKEKITITSSNKEVEMQMEADKIIVFKGRFNNIDCIMLKDRGTYSLVASDQNKVLQTLYLGSQKGNYRKIKIEKILYADTKMLMSAWDLVKYNTDSDYEDINNTDELLAYEFNEVLSDTKERISKIYMAYKNRDNIGIVFRLADKEIVEMEEMDITEIQSYSLMGEMLGIVGEESLNILKNLDKQLKLSSEREEIEIESVVCSENLDKYEEIVLNTPIDYLQSCKKLPRGVDKVAVRNKNIKFKSIRGIYNNIPGYEGEYVYYSQESVDTVNKFKVEQRTNDIILYKTVGFLSLADKKIKYASNVKATSTKSLKVLAAELVARDKGVILDRKHRFYMEDALKLIMEYKINKDTIKIWIGKYYFSIYLKCVNEYINKYSVSKDWGSVFNNKLELMGETNYSIGYTGTLKVDKDCRQINNLIIPRECELAEIYNLYSVDSLVLSSDSENFQFISTKFGSSVLIVVKNLTLKKLDSKSNIISYIAQLKLANKIDIKESINIAESEYLTKEDIADIFAMSGNTKIKIAKPIDKNILAGDIEYCAIPLCNTTIDFCTKVLISKDGVKLKDNKGVMSLQSTSMRLEYNVIQLSNGEVKLEIEDIKNVRLKNSLEEVYKRILLENKELKEKISAIENKLSEILKQSIKVAQEEIMITDKDGSIIISKDWLPCEKRIEIAAKSRLNKNKLSITYK